MRCGLRISRGGLIGRRAAGDVQERGATRTLAHPELVETGTCWREQAGGPGEIVRNPRASLVIVDDRPLHALVALVALVARHLGLLKVVDGLIDASHDRAQPRHGELPRGHVAVTPARVAERQCKGEEACCEVRGAQLPHSIQARPWARASVFSADSTSGRMSRRTPRPPSISPAHANACAASAANVRL